MRLPQISLRALFAFMTLVCVVCAFPQVVFYAFVFACCTIVLLGAALCAMGIMLATIVFPVWITLDTIKRYREKP